MKTVVTALALVQAAIGVPAAAQEAEETSTSQAFEEAFDDMSVGDTDEPEVRDEMVGEWRLYDGPTADGERRVFMHREFAPGRYLEYDLYEGGRATITFVDPDCSFAGNFGLEELGEDRAAGLAEKFADVLDEDACDARAAIPVAEELAEPLALLDQWVADRPFPAASYWKAETRPLALGQGEGSGVGRYEGKVSIVYLEPDEDARGPAEVAVNIYECAAFSGRTLPVRSGDPADAQDIARAVLEERAEACGLDPATPARLADGLPEGLALQKQHSAARAAEDEYAYDESEDDLDFDDTSATPEGT